MRRSLASTSLAWPCSWQSACGPSTATVQEGRCVPGCLGLHAGTEAAASVRPCVATCRALLPLTGLLDASACVGPSIMQPGKRLTVSCVLFVCHQVDAELSGALASVSELIFFVLGAMAIVEVRQLHCWCVWGELCLPVWVWQLFVASNLHPAGWHCADVRCACVVLCCAAALQVVDTHGGFNRLAAWVRADQRQILTWFVALLTFCMSAVLDNLTTTIVMISVLQVRLATRQQYACLFDGVARWGVVRWGWPARVSVHTACRCWVPTGGV